MSNTKNISRHKQREIAMTCIYQYLLIEDRTMDEIFESNLPLDNKPVIAKIIELTTGPLNHLDEYEEELNQFLSKSDWEFNRLGYVEQSILLLAMHEIKNDHDNKGIYVNEAVELAKTYCDSDTYKLINGVLDNL